MCNFAQNSRIMKLRPIFLFFLSMTSTVLLAQETFPQYGKPVDIPIYLSATFGELRPNHLHAGLDIKTQGVEGKKVYAVADGYVSRIGVSPYGYGNVLYQWPCKPQRHWASPRIRSTSSDPSRGP